MIGLNAKVGVISMRRTNLERLAWYVRYSIQHECNIRLLQTSSDFVLRRKLRFWNCYRFYTEWINNHSPLKCMQGLHSCICYIFERCNFKNLNVRLNRLILQFGKMPFHWLHCFWNFRTHLPSHVFSWWTAIVKVIHNGPYIHVVQMLLIKSHSSLSGDIIKFAMIFVHNGSGLHVVGNLHAWSLRFHGFATLLGIGKQTTNIVPYRWSIASWIC